MAAEDPIAIAFDVYGTLLNPSSVEPKLQSLLGSSAGTEVAAQWRVSQLEMTWLLNSMGQFEDFPTVTRRALQHALHKASQSLSDAQIGDMMTAYNALEPFPDVIRGLQLLEQHSATVHPVVFSNGSAEMLDAVLRGKAVAGKAAGKEEGQAGGLGQKVDVFRGYVSLAELRRYKPVREGYELLVKKVGRDPSKAGDRERVWVVSSNEWDVLGAKTAGLQACWVDRAGRGYGAGLLGSETRPDFVGRDLEDAISKIVGSQVE